MPLMKPSFDGIGTASGVAWPLFGIISSAFSFGIGSAISLAFGGVCGGLFLFIGLPIIYSSYKKFKQRRINLHHKNEIYQEKLIANLRVLFKSAPPLSTLQDFLLNKAQALENAAAEEENQFVARLLRYLARFSPALTFQTSDKRFKTAINNFLTRELRQQPSFARRADKWDEAFTGFAGAFGTIAGGAAGLTGLLMGIGVMASFSAFPWVGVAIIVLAGIIGLYAAVKAAKRVEKDARETYRYKCEKRLNKAISELDSTHILSPYTSDNSIEPPVQSSSISILSLMKPALDGIGTASGVAWPLFGIISSAFSFAIGGMISFTFGGVCGGLFLLIGLPIIYSSYKKFKQQQNNLQHKNEIYQKKLIANLHVLFKSAPPLCTLQDFLLNKAEELEKKEAEEKKPVARLLRHLASLSPALTSQYKHLNQVIDNFLTLELQQQSSFARSADKWNEAFIGFAGAFGTIAGGAAGLTGLLMGIGVMASFSAFPWVGVAIIVLAGVIGLFAAVKAAKRTENDARETYRYKCEKELSKSISELNSTSFSPTPTESNRLLTQTIAGHMPPETQPSSLLDVLEQTDPSLVINHPNKAAFSTSKEDPLQLLIRDNNPKSVAVVSKLAQENTMTTNVKEETKPLVSSPDRENNIFVTESNDVDSLTKNDSLDSATNANRLFTKKRTDAQKVPFVYSCAPL